MIGDMDGSRIRSLSGGMNQSGVRNHNERLILSILQRGGGMPGSELARRTGLSAPAISAILRKMENDDFIVRGAPTRGRVGKPSIPMNLNPAGVLSLGLRIGRQSADLLLLDFSGNVENEEHTTYDYPLPETVFGFLEQGLPKVLAGKDAKALNRLCGIGIATPFELWKWNDLSGAAAEKFRSWKDVDFTAEVSRFSDLNAYVVNDATAACRAEHLYGRGKAFRDYAYFFIGSFIGGGIVLNNTVFEGNQGNAGAVGSIRATGPLGENQQLIDVASIHLLRSRLVEDRVDPDILWRKPQDWSMLSKYLDPWIDQTAQELAKASLSICSVIDFEAILIDGAFPADVRDELVVRIRRYLLDHDTRGLIVPKVEAGSVGGNARGIGAASSPIFQQFFLNANAAPES